MNTTPTVVPATTLAPAPALVLRLAPDTKPLLVPSPHGGNVQALNPRLMDRFRPGSKRIWIPHPANRGWVKITVPLGGTVSMTYRVPCGVVTARYYNDPAKAVIRRTITWFEDTGVRAQFWADSHEMRWGDNVHKPEFWSARAGAWF